MIITGFGSVCVVVCLVLLLFFLSLKWLLSLLRSQFSKMNIPNEVDIANDVHNSVLTDEGDKSSYDFLLKYTTGEQEHAGKLPKYVCHTSTIPLATVVDFEWLVDKRFNDYQCKVITEFHGYSTTNSEDSDGDSVCSKRSCMYVGSYDRKRKSAHRYANCACQRPELLNARPGKDKGRKLKPFCFMKFLRNQGEALKRTQGDDTPLQIDPEEVMFCPDAFSVLDAKFSGPMLDHCKFMRSGISCMSDCKTADELIGILRTLYWFREFWSKFNFVNKIREQVKVHGINFVIKAIKQSLHTINGLLVKKMLVFPGELSSYNCLTIQTTRLFDDFFREYCDIHNEMPKANKIYSETKKLFQYCKATFFVEYSDVIRRSFLGFEFKNVSLKKFFSSEFNLLEQEISKGMINQSDYTMSMAWRYRCGLFCQTRVVGFLPSFAASEAMEEFRVGISRERKSISLARRKFIQRVTIRGVFKQIRRNCMLDEKIIENLYSSIEMDIKLSASKDHTIREGGRLEDARTLLRLAIEFKWTIAKRDLEDLTEKDLFVCDELSDNLAEPIFWISVQLGINYLIDCGLLDKGFKREFWFINPDNNERELYALNPLECEIVHINETGKVRNLVKSRSILAWILSPGSKISQELLARLKEHESGLKAGAQGWAHTRRIGGETTESDFMYKDDGTIGRIFHGFKDWKEATDFLSKDIGLASLDAFLTYVGFPKMYKRVILLLLNQPQPVAEARYMSVNEDGHIHMEPLTSYKAQINDGFMMGNQFTKTILHLVHVVELETAKLRMKSMGLISREIRKGEFKSTRAVTVLPESEDLYPRRN